MDKESIYKRESSAIYTFKVGIAILQLFHTPVCTNNFMILTWGWRLDWLMKVNSWPPSLFMEWS